MGSKWKRRETLAYLSLIRVLYFICYSTCKDKMKTRNELHPWLFTTPEHSSETRCLCLMKWPSEMIQNFVRIISKTYIIFFVIHFVFQNCGKFWIILLVHQIKHNPHISGEWYRHLIQPKKRQIINFSTIAKLNYN